MDRLSKGEQILGVSFLVLLILSFLKLWAKIEVDGGAFGVADASSKYSAWDAYGPLIKLGFLTALIAVIIVGLRAAGVNMPQLPMPLGTIYLILAGITAVTVLLTLLVGPSEDAGFLGIEVSRGIGLFIGTTLGLAGTFGAYLHKQGGEPAPELGGGPATPPPAS